MKTIDTAVGPKVKQDNLAPEVFVHADRCRVEPHMVGWELLGNECAHLFLTDGVGLSEKAVY